MTKWEFIQHEVLALSIQGAFQSACAGWRRRPSFGVCDPEDVLFPPRAVESIPCFTRALL